ncbi:hypothetical protein NEUTE1DRAFT_102323 [Neurospora tetrasperma FGSC 2508]|uniref:Uncharacterized protein n=1 Tax=Neurospora tetrasperma (strain FGSC 2508 / ATCC MYA-4615 / P0657) TaxID=510951 RepID=F8MP73_NEUT8|nr:uncharacterized protein NEUTE1DRAFT_102323 [Neurospora tetrasperma FGSC 2508]EGO57085.1 hypothetical protein NEUTE1DRAFT_102323 [Neurospora tetrasperma FGSC 2508]EGZ70003.1 hypothetical protein NEUTE2DRAFT_130028 [Neurospora tetrasperma FGSC 2509]
MEARGNVREEQILDTAGATLAQDRPEFLESPDWSTFGTRTYNIPEARLTFPHLTILALHGLPFDENSRHFLSLPTSSFRLRELVLVLKGAPHLSCLELSARVAGTGRPRGAIIQELCRNYLHAGGRALQKLRYIKLGKGFELYFPRNPGYNYNHPAGFLGNLLDFSRLEELHLFYDDYVDGPYLIEAHHPKDFTGINLAFNTHLARKLIHALHLPSLRKLTLPWADGYAWEMIYYDSKFTLRQNLVINFVDEFHLQDQHRPRGGLHPYSYLWRVHTLLRPFPLSGLVLPTNGMSLPEQNLSHLVSLTTLKSLKTILPPLCDFGFFCATHDTTHVECNPGELSSTNISTITWQLRRIRNLRELWLAGDSRHKSYKCIVEHIRSHHSLRIEHLAMAFIQRFRKLEYIRILDRAWRIARRDDADDKDNEKEEKEKEEKEKEGYCSDDDMGGEERTEAVARELSPWEVENDVPDAFDYRTPSLFRGR